MGSLPTSPVTGKRHDEYAWQCLLALQTFKQRLERHHVFINRGNLSLLDLGDAYLPTSYATASGSKWAARIKPSWISIYISKGEATKNVP